MGPEAEPYRPSWLPFGSARLAASSGESTRGGAGGMGTPVRTRINMAPIQLGRAANQRRMQAPVLAPTMPPVPAMSSAPQRPQRPPQRPPVHATPSPAPAARTYAATSTPNRATEAPSRTSYVPSSRAPAPALPAGVSTTGRMPRQRPVGQRPVGTGWSRPPGAPPFDGLAIAAILMTFIVPPFALVLAIASLRRAYAKGVSPLLSWLALLMSGVGTLLTLGLLSWVAETFQGIGG